MMQQEFEGRVGDKLEPSAWEVVHQVYQFHPAIPDVGGKDVIAALWKIGGIGLMTDMKAAADQVLAAEEKAQRADRRTENQRRQTKEVLQEMRREERALRAEAAKAWAEHRDLVALYRVGRREGK